MSPIRRFYFWYALQFGSVVDLCQNAVRAGKCGGREIIARVTKWLILDRNVRTRRKTATASLKRTFFFSPLASSAKIALEGKTRGTESLPANTKTQASSRSHSHVHAYGPFRFPNWPDTHVFGLWERSAVRGGRGEGGTMLNARGCCYFGVFLINSLIGIFFRGSNLLALTCGLLGFPNRIDSANLTELMTCKGLRLRRSSSCPRLTLCSLNVAFAPNPTANVNCPTTPPHRAPPDLHSDTLFAQPHFLFCLFIFTFRRFVFLVCFFFPGCFFFFAARRE